MKFSSKICPKIKIYNLLYLVILSVKLRKREREREKFLVYKRKIHLARSTEIGTSNYDNIVHPVSNILRRFLLK